MLSSKIRAHLSGLAHDLKPVILVGHKGITDAVVKETQGALLAHELIKVRLPAAGEDGDAELDGAAADIAARSGAALVTRLGRVAILYKAHPQKPRIVLPKATKDLFAVVDSSDDT